jgi:integrase
MGGSVIKRGDDKYLIRFYLGVENGKRKYYSEMVTGGQKNAEARLRELLVKKDKGAVSKQEKKTVEKHLEEWLEFIKNRVGEVTLRDYEAKARIYIIPEIGKIRLDKLKNKQITALYNKMTADGLSSRTVRYAHVVLKSSLKQAVIWGEIFYNPADGAILPKKKEVVKPKVFSAEQAMKFLSEAKYSRWYAFFSLMLASGMRPSEALALKWSDVDFDHERITINKTLNRPPGGGWKLEETKTDKSRRTIPIPPAVMADLKEHKSDQREEIIGAKPGEYTNHGFVFAAVNGEPADGRHILHRHFKPLLKKAELPDMRLYDLRHTCATLLFQAGENPKKVSERLGHADIVLTLNTYTHMLPDMQQSCVDKLNPIFENRHTKMAH